MNTATFGSFSEERFAVQGALATPASSRGGGTGTTSSLRPPLHSTFSVLPTIDTPALSDNDADLFDSNSDPE